MLNMKKMIVGVALLAVMPLAQAAVDWTPKLTGLQDSCSNSFHIMDELPKKYQASIIKKSDKTVKDSDGSKLITTTYDLKNAIAFNHPLDKIEEKVIEDNFHWKSFSMVFKDTAFMTLRPSFYFKSQSPGGASYIITTDSPKNGIYRDSDIDMTYQNDKFGYEVEDTSVEGDFSCNISLYFDEVNKSLSCDALCG